MTFQYIDFHAKEIVFFIAILQFYEATTTFKAYTFTPIVETVLSKTMIRIVKDIRDSFFKYSISGYYFQLITSAG